MSKISDAAIAATLASIDKKFGTGTLIRYGDKPKVVAEVIPTGLPSLDKALGIGGVPLGRIIEIYGPESSGKTTLSLHLAAECQKMGKIVAFIDVEHALDAEYAANLGVDMENVLFSQPDSGEQALELTELIARSGNVSLIIIDSVAALVPRAEIDGEMGDSLPGLQARLMSQAMRKLTPVASVNNCTILFINQLREKIGITYGSNETTTGGKALKFYASMRLDIRRTGALKGAGEKIIGNETKIKVVKNKLAPPFKEVRFDIIYGLGISKEGDLLDLAIQAGIIEKKGAWFYYNGVSIGQGREKAREALKSKDLYDEINSLVKEI